MIERWRFGIMTNEEMDKFDWYGQQVQTGAEDGVQMVDSGTGKPHILRSFEYAIDPVVNQKMIKDKIPVDKQMIFNSHWPQIRVMLWGDGLVANEDITPRVVMGPKSYRIFVLCEPKLRTMVADKPKTLQEVFKNKR